MAAALIEGASIRDVEQELRRLNEAAAEPGETTTLRTRVLTVVAWVPPEWEHAALSALDGLRERHPSRTILLHPDPGSARDALDVSLDLRCFAQGGESRAVCSEVVRIWLRGRRAYAPASVVQPLLVSDLPAYVRWRGVLPIGSPELEQLVDVADRLIVDGAEWPEPGPGYRALRAVLDRIVVSDLTWARIEPWRRAVAALWPAVAGASTVRVAGPPAESLLLVGWLRARLGRTLGLEREPAAELASVVVDDLVATPEDGAPLDASDQLSNQLELAGRDAVYEECVAALALGSGRG